MDIAHQLSMALTADLSAFEHQAFLSSDMDDVEAAVFMLRGSFLKKWEPNGVSKTAEDAAFAKFAEVNQRMLSWTLELKTLQDELLYGMFENEMYQLLEWRLGDECDFQRLADGLGFGPGNIVEGVSDVFHEKAFDSTLTATSDWCTTLYRTAVSRSPMWALAEKQRFETHGFKTVAGCRLFFAPKYAHIARTCSTQPGVNMALQKGVDSFILGRLAEWGINLSRQATLNQELARRGSIDGRMCTIDLSSASDCTSLALVRKCVPKHLLKWIETCRTPVTEYKNRQIELGMVSMMGNGFTFSLETAIFASAVKAVYRLMGLPLKVGNSNDWGVFGDDIVVDRKAYFNVVRLLTLLGYEVNGDKSFHAGHFRESCGTDWWKGSPVRGVYLRRLKTDADRYSAINRLNRWSARTGVPLTCVVQLIRGEIVASRPHFVPPSEGDDAGIKVPFDATRPRVGDDYSFLYRKLQVVNPRWHPPESDEDGHHSPSVGVAILGGYLRVPDRDIHPGLLTGLAESPVTKWEVVRIGYRRNRPGVPNRMKVATASIPWWDFAPRDVFRDISFGGWKAAVTGNLLI